MPGARFLMQGVKRIFDTRDLYAQLVVTDDCNLSCGYCKVAALNDAGLDMMQISVDSIAPTAFSHKALKVVLPKLHMLAREARFHVKLQSVLTAQTYQQYDEFRTLLADLPFACSFSLLHEPGGHVAIQGEQYVRLLEEHDLFAGMQFYRQHVIEMLRGDDSRAWQCLGGSKFLYVTARGDVQYCRQNQAFRRPLLDMTSANLRANNQHNTCESGCALGCVRLISHALEHPLRTCVPVLLWWQMPARSA